MAGESWENTECALALCFMVNPILWEHNTELKPNKIKYSQCTVGPSASFADQPIPFPGLNMLLYFYLYVTNIQMNHPQLRV